MIKNICIWLLVFIGCIIVLEVLGRLTGFTAETWSTLDPILGYRMRKSRFHPQDTPLSNPIVFLGDSITYALYYEPVAFSTRLQEQGYTIANLSSIGYGTDQEYLLLKQHVAEIQNPRAIILHFCLYNDWIDNSNSVNPHDGYRKKPYFTLEKKQLVLHTDHLQYDMGHRIILFFNQRSGAIYFMRKLFKKIGLIKNKPTSDNQFRFSTLEKLPTVEQYDIYMKRNQKSMPLTAALLQTIDQMIQKKWKKRLLIVLHPSSYRPAGSDFLQLEPSIAHFFRNTHIPTYDLGCYYKKKKILFHEFSRDTVGHLNQRGHEIVSNWLDQYLRNQTPEPSCWVD